MQLFHAARQWAVRPDDERFDSLRDMHVATRAYAASAVGATARWKDLRAETDGSDVVIVGQNNRSAKMTHHAFGQVAARAGAPAKYLRALPANLAAQNLNHGLQHTSSTNDAKLLFHQNGGLLLRAATTEVYERVWNYEIVDRLRTFAATHGMVPAQKTFDWSQARPGVDSGLTTFDPNADKALYASDHDMFAFLMDPQKVIRDPTGAALRRGMIVGNSEVGAGSLWFMYFLFRDVCANHIIWGAEGTVEVRLRHTGDIREKWGKALVKVRQALDTEASGEEAALREALVRIGDTKDEVLDSLFGIRKLGLSRKLLEESYEAVDQEVDGDARSVWGFVQGMTRTAQTRTHADERHALDRAAGKLLEMAF